MQPQDILTQFDIAVNTLFLNDKYLFIKRISERSIAFKLAQYLQPLFSEYNVDCEYNGDVDKVNDIKALHITAEEITAINLEANENDNYRISPDIIIHKRGSNLDNILVIEVKKDGNPKKLIEFDILKLKNLTINYSGNHYNYILGISIIFHTRKNTGLKQERYFQNGVEVTDRNNLK